MGTNSRGWPACSAANDAQDFHFLLDVQPVPAFYFDRGRAVRGELVEESCRLLRQRLNAGLANLLRGGLNPAAGLRDLFVSFAAQAQLVIIHAAAGKNQMRVRIDKAGHDHAPAAVDGLSAQAQRLALQRARRADAQDRLSLRQQAAPGDNSQFAKRRARGAEPAGLTA